MKDFLLVRSGFFPSGHRDQFPDRPEIIPAAGIGRSTNVAGAVDRRRGIRETVRRDFEGMDIHLRIGGL
jgi:hypothetical protein